MDFELRSNPRYREWAERDLSLQREKVAIDDRLQEAQARRAGLGTKAAVTKAAVALLDGDAPDEADALDLDAEIRALRRRGDILGEAIKLSKARETDIVNEIAREVGPALRARYVRILGALIPVVEELGQLAELERDFRRDLLAQGFPLTSALTALPPRDAIIGEVERGSLGRWLDEVRRTYPELAEVDR